MAHLYTMLTVLSCLYGTAGGSGLLLTVTSNVKVVEAFAPKLGISQIPLLNVPNTGVALTRLTTPHG